VAAGRDNATCAAISDAAAHWDATTSACVVAQQACSADSSNGVCTGGTVKDTNGTCATGTCGAADFGDDTKACCKADVDVCDAAAKAKCSTLNQMDCTPGAITCGACKTGYYDKGTPGAFIECEAQQACSADSSNGVCTGGTVKDANGTCATGTCGAADFGDDTKACCKTEFSPSSPASAPSSVSAPSPSESEMDEETFVFLLSAGKMAGTNVFHAALTFVVAVWAVAC
jgi:hypothetical protein